MEKQEIITNGKKIASLFIFSGDNLDKVINEVPFIKEIGYAGYQEKEWLKNSLEYMEIGGMSNYSLLDYNKIIEKSVEEALRKCKQFLEEEIFLFVLPTSDEFVKVKMGGINGFTSWKNTIILMINSERNFQENLANRIVHEVVHTIFNYNVNEEFSLGESLINEGLAENFRESVFGGKEPWTEALNREEYKKIFEEIKDDLYNKEYDHGEIFFGTGKYPNWAGYTIGYNLVKRYLKKKYPNGTVVWKEIFAIPIKIILEDSLTNIENSYSS